MLGDVVLEASDFRLIKLLGLFIGLQTVCSCQQLSNAYAPASEFKKFASKVRYLFVGRYVEMPIATVHSARKVFPM